MTHHPDQYHPYGPQQSPVTPKKSKTWLWVLLGVALVLLLCGGGAVGCLAFTNKAAQNMDSVTTDGQTRYTPGAPTPSVLQVPFGTTLDVNGLSEKSKWTVKAHAPYAKTGYGSLPKNGMFYAITVDVSVSDGSAYVCFCDFAFVAKDGSVYEGTMIDVTGEIDSKTLNAGQNTSGVVTFDVPKAAVVTGAKIELRDAGSNQSFWLLP